MSRFLTIVSSSKGNCAYIAGGGSALLIDAGCSFRALQKELVRLSSYGDKLMGIVITHEHTDHIHGLRVLLGKLNIPVFGSLRTLETLVALGKIPPQTTLIELCEEAEIGGICIRSFGVPHDAAQPIGLKFILPDGRTVGAATDLGQATHSVRDALSGCDLVLLESNYDPGMLSSGPYPWPLKRRISGDLGHLSNDHSASLASMLLSRGTTRFVLGHLSVNNNFPDLAYRTAQAALEAAGGQEGADFLLSVAPAYEAHPVIVF